MSSLETLQRKLERERKARKHAETLLEQKSLELYKANEQLRDLAEQTRAIVDSAAEGIITYDAEGMLLSSNRSAEQIFQLEMNSARDVRTLFESNQELDAAIFPVPNESPHLEDTPDAQGTSCARPLESAELLGWRALGKFPVEIAVSRCVHRGKVTFTALVRDLSRRKQLESRLQQAQKMESMGNLAAGIAHEINTPIQFVSTNIQFLQGAFEDIGSLLTLFDRLVDAIEKQEPTGEILEHIVRQRELADLPFLKDEFPSAIEQSIDGIERVTSIINAMKEFSQPTSEHRTKLNINEVIEHAQALACNKYRDVALITTSLDEDLPLLLCNAAHMSEVVLNLVANSAEAIAESGAASSGRIQITSRKTDAGVELGFQDNGPGIPNDIRKRIFEPFFTTKEVGQGMGQGLAFVYDVIVNKHAGMIDVTCPPKGGTHFVITLPTESQPESVRRKYANTIA